MSSLKTMFCDLCVILLFGWIAVFAEEIPSSTEMSLTPTGNCSCGGFPTVSPAPEDGPLLFQTTGLVVKCDSEGLNTCKSLCNALATATKAKGPEILCTKLKKAKELKLSVFHKICDQPWTYADMTADEPLCCDAGEVNTCLSAQKITAPNTTTSTIDAKTNM